MKDTLRSCCFRLFGWIERTPTEDLEWRDVGGISSALVWLTHDDVADVEKTITDLIDKYRGRAAGDHPDGARRVRIGVLVYPNDEL